MASNDELTVRTIREGDLAAIVEIDAQAGGTSRAAYLQDKLQQSQSSGHAQGIAVVAESNGAVVGLMMGRVSCGEFGIHAAVATVDTVAIHPEFQGRGTGRRLMGEFLLRAKKAGAAQVRTIVDWKQWEVMGFFRSLGFAPGTDVVLQRRV